MYMEALRTTAPEGGPSRTDNAQGIQNADWKVVLDWDGHQPATEPGNPDIVYGEKTGRTFKGIDMKTGEIVDIQPQPAEGEPYERFNWDSPILVSPTSLLPSILLLKGMKSKTGVMRGQQFHPILPKTRTGCNYPSWAAHRATTMPGICLPCQTTIPSHRFLNHRYKRFVVRGHRRWSHPGDWRWWQNWRKIDITALFECASYSLYQRHQSRPFLDAATVYVALDNPRVAILNLFICKSR